MTCATIDYNNMVRSENLTNEKVFVKLQRDLRSQFRKLLEIYKVSELRKYHSTCLCWSPAKNLEGQEWTYWEPGLSVSQMSMEPSLKAARIPRSAPGGLLSRDWLMSAGPGLIMRFDWPLAISDLNPGLWKSPGHRSITSSADCPLIAMHCKQSQIKQSRQEIRDWWPGAIQRIKRNFEG